VDEKNENGDLGIDMVITMSPSVRARAVGALEAVDICVLQLVEKAGGI
jgi:hypothetical protein